MRDAVICVMPLSKFVVNEPRSVVTDDNIMDAVSAELLSQFSDGGGLVGARRKMSVCPLRMGVDHHQYHSTRESICSRDQGRSGNGHGCRGASVGLGRLSM